MAPCGLICDYSDSVLFFVVDDDARTEKIAFCSFFFLQVSLLFDFYLLMSIAIMVTCG